MALPKVLRITHSTDNVTIINDDQIATAKDIAINKNLEDLASARGQIGNNIRINTVSDLNTYTKAGNWLFSDAAAGENFPNVGRGGELNCYVSTTAIFQFFTEFNNNRRYIRYGIPNSTWTNWIQFISVAQLGDGIRTTQGIISVPEYEGATESSSGTSGLVPPATAGEQNNFLTGGGEYKSALSTAGGELTGSIGIVDVNNVANTAPSADTEHGFYVEDKNKFVMGGFDFLQRKSHNNDKVVQMFSKNSQGNYHVISVATAEDGTGQATITCPTYIAGAVTNLSGTYVSSATERYRNSALEIRENNYVSNTQTDIGYAPSIGFHWGNTTNGTLVLKSDGAFAFINGSGARATVNANVPYSSESGTSTKWNGATKTVSTAAPSGGANGDIWFQY